MVDFHNNNKTINLGRTEWVNDMIDLSNNTIALGTDKGLVILNRLNQTTIFLKGKEIVCLGKTSNNS